MKTNWIFAFSTLSLALGAEAAQLGDIVRKGDPGTESYCLNATSHEVCRMNHYDAEKYCREQGSRLPTVRELAEESQRQNARGILKTDYPGVAWTASEVKSEIKRMEKRKFSPDKFQAIYASSSSKETVVDFYFNNAGYRRPAGDLGNFWFWSSSVHPEVPGVAYDLSGGGGDIYSAYRRSDDDAVRCVRSP